MGRGGCIEINTSEKNRHTKRIDIVEQKFCFSFFFFFLFCIRIVKSSRLSSFSFILSVSNCIYFFFFFDFYRWSRFNSLLIRCCSFHGSFADPNRVLELAELFSFFSSLSLHGSFGGNCFLGKRKTVVYFLLANFCFYSSLTTFAKCSRCTIIEFFRMNFKIRVDEVGYLYLSV